MKTLNGFIKKMVMLLALISLFSCVGTVKDATPTTSDILKTGSSAPAISFEGLIKAEAIAHDKVELQFSPADGSDDIIYEIYVNNSPIPIKVNGKSLTVNANGNYFFTITNLQMNTTYSFNIRATVASFSSDSRLDPSKSLFATTFNNQTADFYGISSLTLGAGGASRDSIIVKWNPATILGSSINPKDTDPVQYEITYISQLGGPINLNNSNYNGPDRRTIYTPATLSNPPALNKDKQYTISGLTPGVTYYVQVRAIHKGYISYGSDPLYKRERNSRFLRITTSSSAGVFDFETAQVLMSHPLGVNGLTNLDVSWLPATGEFNHYRLCYKKVAAPNGTAPATDLLQDSDIDAVLNNPAFCLNLPASTSNYRLSSLDSYAYYQAKVLVCKTANCLVSDRIKSSLMSERVITNVTQFSGIIKVFNPSDDSKLDEIKLTFDSPIISSGYITKMKLYCYNSLTDANPISLPTDGTVSASTGKAVCDGISTASAVPLTLTEFGEFSSLSVKLSDPIDGSRSYCLSLVPVIESAFLNQENLAAAVIKCFTPEIKTPTNVEFTGKNPVCSSSTGRDFAITWPIPAGGLYSKFVIFYKEKNSGTDFFNFPEAVNAYVSNNVASPYKWLDNIDKALIGFIINNLIPGKTYSIGVLPYLESGATKMFGQYNLNVDDCSLPLPTATFDEWVDIFAIGPKEDGLTPPTLTGTRKYIMETLDDDGIPVEMKVNDDEKTPDTSHTLTAMRTSASKFNGVYGAYNGKDINPLNQYSNSGIVKIAWKDISFFSGTSSMNDYIPPAEVPTAAKNIRKYGYRVYRSEDNKTSWVDLTAPNTKNKYQTAFNSGLVQPATFTWKARNNAGSNSDKIVFFTDYSVKFSGTNGETDRARTYWYKIVPVFDGKEITYAAGTNPNHHIIRVTLPPRNMALVHRMMANRTICLEMDKPLNKADGENYSCAYNGIGASGKSTAATIGNTVYDLGGDLLIDRFELSCPITRGDPSYTNSDSTFSGTKIGFKGYSDFGNAFKGCFNEASPTFESVLGGYTPSSNYKSNQVTPGDCFGREEMAITSASSTVCSDPVRVTTIGWIYPGVSDSNLSTGCGDPDNLGTNLFNMMDPTSKINTQTNRWVPTQSEWGAVYYMRKNWTGNGDAKTPLNIPLANGKFMNAKSWDYPSSCQVNLPYLNASNEYRPRWISVNALFDKLMVNGTATTFKLYDKTVGQILSNTTLYDNANVKAPPADLVTNNRYTSSSNVLRMVTSNAAKLPGMTAIGQQDYQSICSTYKVQVGIETASKGFVALDSIQDKRLMRRKESVVASAWPSQYDSIKVDNIEKGTFVEDGNYKGCNGITRLRAPATFMDGRSTYSKGNTFTPNFPNADKTRTFVMGGSSNLDAANLSTEKCVSKFGAQDISGNLSEINSDEIFCDFSQDRLYLGVKDSVPNSLAYNSVDFFDTSNLQAWVLPTPKSGSCSVVEAGGDRTGTYVSGSTFAPIFNFSGINTSIITRAKRFDQEAIKDTRNGDGSFLDFGQANMGPKLDVNNTIALTNPANASNFFSPVLGLPLSCDAGCDGNASDNMLITADAIATAKGYDTILNPLNIPMLDFPINNGVLTNAGISEVANNESLDTNKPDLPSTNYIYDIDVGADLLDPMDNSGKYTSHVPGSGNPLSLQRWSYQVSRSASLHFYTGGSSTTAAGRYSLHISGSTDYDEGYQGYELASRCSVMINQD